MEMLWPAPLRSCSGATTQTSSASRRAMFSRIASPGALMPSSLVIRMRSQIGPFIGFLSAPSITWAVTGNFPADVRQQARALPDLQGIGIGCATVQGLLVDPLQDGRSPEQ